MKIGAIVFLGLMLSVCSSSKVIYGNPSTTSSPGTAITLTPSAFAYTRDKVSQGVVGFSVLIKNEGPEAITIAHPSRCLPSDNLKREQVRQFSDHHGKSEILLKITKPDGTRVILRDGWLYGFDPNNVYHFTIPPGGAKGFYLGWFFQNARGRWENDAEAATVFLDKGTYKVRILFRNVFPWAYIDNKDTSKVHLENVWTGEMQSEEVAIEIR
jgi:hypothetical protein